MKRWQRWGATLVLATVPPSCAATTPREPGGLGSAPRCPPDATYDGRNHQCRRISADLASLDRGTAELRAFRADEAMTALEEAKRNGPYRHEDYVRLFEQIGIAHAYLDREAEALAAFDMVLALSPGHAISYTLSPKVTFVFERARKVALGRTAAEVRVSWPRQLWVDERVPIDVEVVSDPHAFLKRARLSWRKKGTPSVGSVDLALFPVGQAERIALPAVAPGARRGETLELWLSAYDDAGNEVLQWGKPTAPRDLSLAVRPESPWYARWWIWGIAATVVAVATGAVVFAAAQEPPDRIDGTFTAR